MGVPCAFTFLSFQDGDQVADEFPLARVHPDFALGLFQAGAAFGDKGVEPFHEFPREAGKTSERRGFIFMSEGCLLLVVSGWGHGSVILWSCWLLEARTRGRGSPSCPS